MKANNFSEKRPTVILLCEPDTEVKALLDADGEKPRVFPNFVKARKFASQFLDPSLHAYLEFVNEEPEMGVGDKEETGFRKCLKCEGFMRLSMRQSNTQLPDGTTLAVDEMDCPTCDLGEE